MDKFRAFQPQLGQRAGFEIWFAVLIEPSTRQALWVRYTLFRPSAACQLPASGLLWAAFYDAHHPELFAASAKRFDIAEVQVKEKEISFPQALITPERLLGEIQVPWGLLGWDLQLTQVHSPIKYAPPLLENLGIAKTKAIIGAPFAKAQGEVRLGERTFAFAQAGSLLTHIWGSHYLEELYWIFVPHFDGDTEGWALEIVSTRPKPFLPMFTFVILTRHGQIISNHVFEAIAAKVIPHYPQVSFEVKTGDLHLKVDCSLDPAQIARYIYTNPDGARRYISHSDTGDVNCRIESRSASRLLLARTAAVEFHACQPWDQEPYLDPFNT